MEINHKSIVRLAIDKSSGRITVEFPYKEETIIKVKDINGYRWHTKEKKWSFPLAKENLEYLIKIFSGNELQIDKALKEHFQFPDSAVKDDLKEIQRQMHLQNYSNKTIKVYKSCIKLFREYYPNKNPCLISSQEIKNYFYYLIEKKNYSSGAINQIFNALRFLYVEYYKLPFKIGEIPRPRKEKKLPDVLTKEEVSEIFKIVKNLKHLTMLMLSYGSGLRVSELVNLRVEDVDMKRGLIHVRGGKGKKDRYTILSESMKMILYHYSELNKLSTNSWLFPGENLNYHLSARSIQAVFQRAVKAAGINKQVSIHNLRHSFATELLEHGTDLRYIQSLLGHKSTKTTEICTHISNAQLSKIKSPLDLIFSKDLINIGKKDAKLINQKE